MLGVDFIGAKMKFQQKDKRQKLVNYLPYNFFAGEIGEGIVYLKPGALMRTYSFMCPDLGSASAESIAGVSLSLNNAIRRLGENWACHFEVRREITKKYPGTKWNNELGFLIDARRKDLYENKFNHYVNYYYLTLTYAVKPDILSKTNNILYKKNVEEEGGYFDMEKVQKEIQFFRDVTEETISYIKNKLSLRALNDDETLSYIKSAMSSKWRPMMAPPVPTLFDNFITEEDLLTGSCLKLDRTYCPIVAIRDFPSETYPAMFDLLNRALVDYRWVTRWIAMDKVKSVKLIQKYQKHFNTTRKSWSQMIGETLSNTESDRTDPAAEEFESDTNTARVELAKDMLSFGYYTSCIEVYDKDYETAMDKADYIAGIINSCGFGAKVERLNSFNAWLGMLPGNTYSNVRKTILTSSNVSHIIPLSSVWTGSFYNKWTAECFACSAPLLTCSSYGSPLYVNLNVGDVCHSIIFGPAGAGKSTFLCLLETQFTKYKDAQIIILDKDKTARGVTIAAGGSYVEPGSGEVAFQPLADIDSDEGLSWACEWIGLCLSEQQVNLDAEKAEKIRKALLQLRTKPKGRRDLTAFQQYVQDKQIRIGIQPYTINGQYGSIFDARETSLSLSKFTMIEMGILMKMGSPCVTPALMYIFRFIESHFAKPNDTEGHPTLLVLDEAWVFLANRFFEERIDDWLRTLRKKRVAVVFATQDVVNAAKSSIAPTIISQCQTRFYLADPNAESETIKPYYSMFGLEPPEIHALSEARMKNDYFYKSPAGSRMFQLELDAFQLALLCPPSRVLDALEQKYGRNSGKKLAAEILEAQGCNPYVYLKEKGV